MIIISCHHLIRYHPHLRYSFYSTRSFLQIIFICLLYHLILLKLWVYFCLVFEAAWVFGRLLALFTFLLNGKIFVWGLLLYIESLEETLEVEVLEVVGKERELSDYEFDVLFSKLQSLEHFDQIFIGDCLSFVFNVLECNFELIGLAAGHLRYPKNHFLLLTLLLKLEVMDHFSEFAYEGRLIALVLFGLRAHIRVADSFFWPITSPQFDLCWYIRGDVWVTKIGRPWVVRS